MNILRLSVRLRAAPAATSRFLHDKRFSPFSLGATFRAGCRHISIISPRRNAVKALTPAVPSQIPEGGGGGGGEGSGSGSGGGFAGGGGGRGWQPDLDAPFPSSNFHCALLDDLSLEKVERPPHIQSHWSVPRVVL